MRAFYIFLVFSIVLSISCNEQNRRSPDTPMAQAKPESKPVEKPLSEQEKYLKNILEPETSEELKNTIERFERTKIFPQLILRSRITELEEQSKKNGYDFKGFVYDNLDSDLAAIYILETRNSVVYIDPENLKRAGIDHTALSRLAKENLHELIPQLKTEKMQEIYELTIDFHPYAASLILIPELWRKERYDVQGEIVIAIPSSRSLYVGDSKKPTSIQKLRSQIEFVKEHQGGIQLSTKLFVFRDNQFHEFSEEQLTK